MIPEPKVRKNLDTTTSLCSTLMLLLLKVSSESLEL